MKEAFKSAIAPVTRFAVLEIVFESVQQKHLDKTSWEFCPENQHLWLMRYKSSLLGHDCS